MTRFVRYRPRLSGDVLVKHRHNGHGLKVVNDNRPHLIRAAILIAQHLVLVQRALLRLASSRPMDES